MKNLLFVLALCCNVALQACDTGSRPENKTSVDQVDPGERESANLNDDQINESGEGGTDASATAYICPMKCEGSASNEPGKCPVCKMDLVKNPDYKGGTNTTGNEVLNHESEPADDKNLDDKLEGQPAK